MLLAVSLSSHSALALRLCQPWPCLLLGLEMQPGSSAGHVLCAGFHLLSRPSVCGSSSAHDTTFPHISLTRLFPSCCRRSSASSTAASDLRPSRWFGEWSPGCPPLLSPCSAVPLRCIPATRPWMLDPLLGSVQLHGHPGTSGTIPRVPAPGVGAAGLARCCSRAGGSAP